MASPYSSVPRRLGRPRAASPAERAAEFTAIQRRLKREAAARRAKAASDVSVDELARTLGEDARKPGL